MEQKNRKRLRKEGKTQVSFGNKQDEGMKSLKKTWRAEGLSFLREEVIQLMCCWLSRILMIKEEMRLVRDYFTEEIRSFYFTGDKNDQIWMENDQI